MADSIQLEMQTVYSAAMTDPTSIQQETQSVESAAHGRPDHRQLQEAIDLYMAALKGNWKKASKILEKHPHLRTSRITKGLATVLHVAAGGAHLQFVEELVEQMQPPDLEVRDGKQNTALCFAAMVGNVNIARIMCKKNGSLPNIKGGIIEPMSPLRLAVQYRRSQMAWYLFKEFNETPEEWHKVFLDCINSELYDLANDILDKHESGVLAPENGFAIVRGLHVLARKPTVCGCQSLRYRKHLLHFCKKDSPVFNLTTRMWDLYMKEAARQPYEMINIAAKVGNFEFLSVVMKTYPDMIWDVDTMDQSIIHIAVLHRQASIFNLVHEIPLIKNFILTFLDNEGNNLLHGVAKFPSPDRLNIVCGAALQMMFELSWFEEVKNLLPPSFIEMKNDEGITPRQLFTKEHAELLSKGESWMKQTAKSCMVVSTLIATGVFSAAINVPGGNNDNTGSPNYLKKPSFLVFALSNAMAMISSSTSILIFTSILISRYAVDDFQKSLPLKLISGLAALFISIITMMGAFSCAFFIAYYDGLKWVPSFISTLAFLVILLFIFLQFSLWSDIVYSVYICSSLFKPNKRLIK